MTASLPEGRALRGIDISLKILKGSGASEEKPSGVSSKSKKEDKMKEAAVGKWAFLLGIILAVLVGLVAVPYSTLTAVILMVLGLIVGFLNVETKETNNYLVAAVALLVIGIGGINAMDILGVTVYDWVQGVLSNFIAFVGASALVVAIKAIVQLGKE